MGFEIFRRCRWHEYRVTELQTEFLQIFQRRGIVVDHDVEDHDDNDDSDLITIRNTNILLVCHR